MFRNSARRRVTIATGFRLLVGWCAIAVWQGAGGVRIAAEPPTPAAQQASFERVARIDGEPRVVRFAKRAPQVGDQLAQTLAVEMRLSMTMRQGSEVLEQVKTVVERRQHRLVTTTDVVDGTPVAALVRYPTATKQIAYGQTDDQLRGAAVPVTPQSIQGQSYRCRRDGKRLLVTDAAGQIPPLDEFEIVAQNMDTLGRTNPLADYLAGRTVAVGERLSLPNEVAEKLLGLGDELGQVTRFELALRDVREIDGATCAVFDASIEAASSDSSQMRLAVDGPLAIQADSCRAVQARFAGPIGMSETRGSLTATYQMAGTGKMTVGIDSKYHDVQR